MKPIDQGFFRRFACGLILAALTPIPAFSPMAVAAMPGQPADQQEAEKREAWQQEFDEICSKTQDAMTLTVEELKVLIQRCDALEPRIQKLDETRRKLYLRRLQQCRGLYAYVLESKNPDARNKDKN